MEDVVVMALNLEEIVVERNQDILGSMGVEIMDAGMARPIECRMGRPIGCPIFNRAVHLGPLVNYRSNRTKYRIDRIEVVR